MFWNLRYYYGLWWNNVCIDSIYTWLGIVLASTWELSTAAINNAANVMKVWEKLTEFAIFDIHSTPNLDSRNDDLAFAYQYFEHWKSYV